MSTGEDDERKRKLAHLRDKAKRKKADGGGGGDADGDGERERAGAGRGLVAEAEAEEDGGARQVMKFRNYQPYDASLAAPATQPDAPAELTAGRGSGARSADEKEPAEVDVIKRELEQFKTEELNVVPKKPNWDLKAQVEGRLEKLKRRTQRAIVDMLRDKLRKEGEGDL